MKNLEYIQNWCKKKESFFFFLPDGPIGRPFDNSYQMVNISEDDKDVIITLSHDIKFIIEGDFLLREDHRNLIITILGKLIYENKGVIVKCFSKGEFCLSGF